MHANGPVTLNNPSGKEAYLSYHPISVSKCINTISNMELHQNYPLLTHQYAPLPTSTPIKNINTHYQTIIPADVPTPRPSINILVSTPEVPSTTSQQENLQEILSAFDNLVTSQHIYYHSPQFNTTQECVETVITYPSRYLHPAINALATLDNPYATMTPYISATNTIPSNIYDHIPLFPDYDLDISPSML